MSIFRDPTPAGKQPMHDHMVGRVPLQPTDVISPTNYIRTPREPEQSDVRNLPNRNA